MDDIYKKHYFPVTKESSIMFEYDRNKDEIKESAVDWKKQHGMPQNVFAIAFARGRPSHRPCAEEPPLVPLDPARAENFLHQPCSKDEKPWADQLAPELPPADSTPAPVPSQDTLPAKPETASTGLQSLALRRPVRNGLTLQVCRTMPCRLSLK